MIKYQIVELEISMYNSISITRQVVSDVVRYFIISRMSPAKSFPRLLILYRSLLSFDAAPGFAVTGIKVGFTSVSLKANGVWIDRMKPCQSFNSGKPALSY
jgi:hypothetical protein